MGAGLDLLRNAIIAVNGKRPALTDLERYQRANSIIRDIEVFLEEKLIPRVVQTSENTELSATEIPISCVATWQDLYECIQLIGNYPPLNFTPEEIESLHKDGYLTVDELWDKTSDLAGYLVGAEAKAPSNFELCVRTHLDEALAEWELALTRDYELDKVPQEAFSDLFGRRGFLEYALAGITVIHDDEWGHHMLQNLDPRPYQEKLEKLEPRFREIFEVALRKGLDEKDTCAPARFWWRKGIRSFSLIDGGIYTGVMRGDNGPAFIVMKLLAHDERGVHIRLYSNRYKHRPDHNVTSELTLSGNGSMSVGHLPMSDEYFMNLNPELIERGNGHVDQSELDGYRIWQKDAGRFFRTSGQLLPEQDI